MWQLLLDMVGSPDEELQEAAAEHKELSSVLCGDLEGWGGGRVGERLKEEGIYGYLDS